MNEERIIQLVTNYDSIKDDIYPRLINPSNLNSNLAQCWYDEFLDLYIMYHIKLDENSSAIISENMLKYWHIDYDKMRKQAIENIAPKVVMLKMDEALAKYTDQRIELDEEMDMYVITTTYQNHGAGAILVNREWYKDDLVLLPSSIHEFIAIPWSISLDVGYSQLCDVIQSINREIVHPQEVLSDHPYIWNHRTHILQQL